MILVTLGTHPQPMDRLLRAIDQLAEDGVIEEPFVVQAAAFGYRPRHATIAGVRPYVWLRDQVTAADVVISHAGPGTLAMVRSMGRVPIVVPRSATFGEHVDDHQERYAERLRSAEGYLVVTDLGELASTIERARSGRYRPSPADVSVAVAALEAVLARA